MEAATTDGTDRTVEMGAGAEAGAQVVLDGLVTGQ